MESIRAVETPDPGGPPPIADDESVLWQKAAKGDLEAADALARCTYRAVYASLCRLCGGNEGLAADLCVFDPEIVHCGPLQRVFDFPAGADRLVSEARGIRAVVVNGTTIRENGEDRVEPGPSLPGRVLRGGRA